MIAIHLWLGVIIGFLWATQGLTGALLVFHREADRIGGIALTDAPMLPVGKLIAAAEAQARHPLQRLTAVSNDPRLIEARYFDDRDHLMALQMDAATGRVAGRRDRDPATPFTGSAWRWIYLVHIALLSGDVGRTLIGVSGLLLASSTALGFYIGWPGQHWRQAFAVRKWRAIPQKLYGWHRAGGIVAGAGLLILSLTGAYMTFGSAMADMLSHIAPFDPSASMAHMAAGADAEAAEVARITPDQAMRIAQRIFPQGRFMNLELPSEHPGYYSIRFTLPGELRRWAGRAMVQIDPASGAILERYDPSQAPIANRLDDAVYPIHMGEAAGIGGRILTMLAGFSLPLLYGTGLWRWLRRRR